MIWRKEFEDLYAFGYDKNQTPIGAQKEQSSRAPVRWSPSASRLRSICDGSDEKEGFKKILLTNCLNRRSSCERDAVSDLCATALRINIKV